MLLVTTARYALVLLLPAEAALAHEGSQAAEQGMPGWTLDPWVLGPLLMLALLYAAGSCRLRGRAGGGRSRLSRQHWLFAAGWLALAGALISPLHEGGERAFALHMIEHEMIMVLAALLLVSSQAGATILWALPQPARRVLGNVLRWRALASPWDFLSNPILATSLQAVALWMWHMPALFDRALQHEGWHLAQHLSFLISSLIFWWAMTHGRGGKGAYGVSCLCLFATSVIAGLLGALMSFSDSPWYASYAAMGMTPLGLTPVEDQQLAGLLMWIPGGLVHAGVALYFLHKWLKATEERHVATAK